MQGDYSPTLHGALKVGVDQLPTEKGLVQKLTLDLQVPIKRFKCRYGEHSERLYSIEFTMRNGTIEKFGGEDEKATESLIETNVAVPPYEHVKSVLFYGKPVTKEVDSKHLKKTDKVIKDQTPQDPLLSPKKVFVLDYWDFTGLALDILA